jgi:RNA-directed DNA polymerase
MTTKLARFTRRARELRRERLTSLMGLLFEVEGLRASFERQDEKKAPGVDGMRKADYAQGLEDRLVDLSSRLRRLGYRPKPSRRVYVPKVDGGCRRRGRC